MTEWTVVVVVVVLVGLITSIVVPMLKLNSTLTKFTCAVDALKENLDTFVEKNSDSHTRLWKHNEAQDCKIAEHETRITVIEKTKEVT